MGESNTNSLETRMQVASEAVAQGRALEMSGNLAGAVEVYRRVLADHPSCADAWFRLGAAYLKQRNFAGADAAMSRVIELQPDSGEAWSNKGVSLASLGEKAAAEAAFRRAVELRPQLADLHRNLAESLRELGRFDEARRSLQTALQIEPHNVATLFSMAVLHRAEGSLEIAVACLHQLLRCEPAHVAAITELGELYVELGRLDLARKWFQRAISLAPNQAKAWVGLGIALAAERNLDDAIRAFRHALAVRPDLVDAYANLGNALHLAGRDAEARESLEQALRLNPSHAGAHLNLGVVLAGQRITDGAISHFRTAIELKPDYPTAHHNLALQYLLLGRWEEGWKEYEWRWKCKEFTPRNFPQPQWDGRPFPGQTILLYTEQGFGDTIHFVRYAALVKSRGGRVLVESPRSLLSLLSSCEGIDQLIAAGDQLPPFDLVAPLLSLPGILGTEPATVPAAVPYLNPDPAEVQRWRQRLPASGEYKVGVTWRGSPGYISDRVRSTSLAALEPLARIPGVRLYSLQKGAGHEEIAQLAERVPVSDLGSELDERGAAFVDTAAVMKNLDLVISVDSSLAHVAGALAVPVWVALAYSADWRWMLERDDTPWYPTMRLFRQTSPGDWAGVFERMATQLTLQVAQSSHSTSRSNDCP